jgi:hypothetical protein
LQPNNSQSPMGRGARRQQDHPRPEAKSPDSPVISGEEQVAPCCGPRNPSSSATKRMNQQGPGVVRPNLNTICTTRTSRVPNPFLTNRLITCLCGNFRDGD